jgi:NIMA (never in mitosis gene a)-related kinase 1/4/5
VRRKENQKEYALKKVNLEKLSEKEKTNAINEVRILASIRNQNVIQYKEVFVDKSYNSLCIVMEFANNGDLYQKIVRNQKENLHFNETEIWMVLIQTVSGLKALHDINVMHRDIKSANIFLNKD